MQIFKFLWKKEKNLSKKKTFALLPGGEQVGDQTDVDREMTARSLVQMEKDEQREGMALTVIASAVLRQFRRK